MSEVHSGFFRILLVENHADTRDYLALYLQSSGYHVTTAATMAEALTAAPQGDYDVLLSDIGLPDGDGWQLLQQAEFTHPILAVAMSGFGMNADRERSKHAGYHHHLLKPLDIEKLDGLLAEAAEKAKASHR